MLTSWLSAFGNFGTTRRPVRRQLNRGNRGAAACLEQLEERALLSTFHVSTTGDNAAAALDPTFQTPFRTVQAAITAAASADDGNDEIKVAAGVYNEINVDGKWSIPDSANITNLVISGGWNVGYTARTAQTSTYIPNVAAQDPLTGADGDIDVVDANVTIDGFHFVFDGNGVGGTGGTRVSGGIVVQATGVTINDNTIEIGGNPVSGIRSTGIQTASSDTSNLTISDNTITANGVSRATGIFLNPGVGANTLIDGNELSGTSFAAMIVVKERGDVTISDNVLQRSGAATGFQAIDVRSGDSVTAITNLVIDGNTIDGGGSGTGIHIGDIQNTGVQPITGFEITNNIIANHVGSYAIVIGGGATQPNAISGTINYNSITGNTNGIFRSPLVGIGSTAVDASRNWWGDISGPTVGTNPGGLGQSISDPAGITFGPWLIYSADSDAGLPGVQLPVTVTVNPAGEVSAADNDFTRLQNAIGAAADGQTINILGNYDWTTPLSSAAYTASTNTSATADIRGVEIPDVDDLTITSSDSSASILGQGDFGLGIYDTFLFTDDGVNTGNANLIIESLDIVDFESAVMMGWNVTGVFNGTKIRNNTITLAGDDEGTQNIAIYLTQGINQEVTGNTVTFQADGTSASMSGPRSFGFQNSTTGGTGYNGLIIDGNTFQLGTTSLTTETVFGIWENGHNDDDASIIAITDNDFVGRQGIDDFDNALQLTSQTAGLSIDGNSFTDVDNVFFARNASGGTDVGDEFTITNSELTRVGGADGIFLRNVTTDAITVQINWGINNTIDGFTGVRGLNELSTQATGATRTLSAASDINSVFAVGEITEIFVDDNFGAVPRFGDSDGIGSGAGPIAFGFNTVDTIAAGIAATDANETVSVLEGTYAESPTLTDGRTLRLYGDVTVDSLDTDLGTTVDLQTFFLTLGDNVGNNTLAGLISGTTGGLVKAGTDTLTLTGNNTYDGTTTVDGGTLFVDGTITSDTIVNTTGTLAGIGNINGLVNVLSGGTLAPGNGTGIISADDLTLVAGSTFAVEVNGATAGTQADQVAVSGTVDLTGATLSPTGTIASFPGQVITLISNAGADSVIGTFNNLPEGSSILINGHSFTVSYTGGPGNNDVTLTEVNAAFSIDDVTVNEADGTLVFTVTLDKALDIDVTIDVTFTDGTATGGGTDYTSTTQQVTFLAGETSHTVNVPINNDNLVEGTENFFASLSTSTALGGRVINFNDTGTGTITDNDVATVSITAINDGAESGTPTNGLFRVSLSSASATDTVVNYTVGGTATPGAGNDYSTLSGTVTIPAGQLSADIVVNVLNDALVESTETVTVTLTGLVSNDPQITLDLLPANVTATVNITDSDTLTIISDATATVPENTPAGTVIIDVNTNDTPDNTVVYTLSGPDALLFNINPATGEITFVNSPDFELPLDSDGDNVYQLTVTATGNFIPPQIATQDLTITVTGVNEFGPVFVDASPTFTIPENSPAGTSVGTVTATDADQPASSLTYSIVAGNSSGAFTINPTTGEITVAQSSPLDFEQTQQFTLTVRVTDNGSPAAQTADAIVEINLTDAQEGPTVTIPNPQGTYNLGRVPAYVAPTGTFTNEGAVNPSYDGSVMVVSITAGRNRRDRLVVYPKSLGSDGLQVRGRRIFSDGVKIATVKGGRGNGRNADLKVTFNENATTSDIDSIVRRISFRARTDVGVTRTVTIQVTNIGGTDSNIGTRDIAVVNNSN